MWKLSWHVLIKFESWRFYRSIKAMKSFKVVVFHFYCTQHRLQVSSNYWKSTYMWKSSIILRQNKHFRHFDGYNNLFRKSYNTFNKKNQSSDIFANFLTPLSSVDQREWENRTKNYFSFSLYLFFSICLFCQSINELIDTNFESSYLSQLIANGKSELSFVNVFFFFRFLRLILETMVVLSRSQKSVDAIVWIFVDFHQNVANS